MNKTQTKVVGDLTFRQISPVRFTVQREGSDTILSITRVPARHKVKFQDGTRGRYDDPVWVGCRILRRQDRFPINFGAIVVDTTPERVWERTAHVLTTDLTGQPEGESA